MPRLRGCWEAPGNPSLNLQTQSGPKTPERSETWTSPVQGSALESHSGIRPIPQPHIKAHGGRGYLQEHKTYFHIFWSLCLGSRLWRSF